MNACFALDECPRSVLRNRPRRVSLAVLRNWDIDGGDFIAAAERTEPHLAALTA